MALFPLPPSPAELLALALLTGAMLFLLVLIHWVLWLCGCYT
jgi:hypothetical protein